MKEYKSIFEGSKRKIIVDWQIRNKVMTPEKAKGYQSNLLPGFDKNFTGTSDSFGGAIKDSLQQLITNGFDIRSLEKEIKQVYKKQMRKGYSSPDMPDDSVFYTTIDIKEN